MVTSREIDTIVKTQLSYEFNCRPENFSGSDNVITSAVLHEKRRMFSDKAFFLQMATFGKGAVISADERMHPWLREWVKGREGFWLFEQHNYYELEQELRKYGYKMSLTHQMYLPVPRLMEIKTDLKVKWLEQGDIAEYYSREEFSNALCDEFKPERPDVLAVVALDGDKIMGMAGCSEDCKGMWQIGIDVLPEYRGRGIAKTLVTLLRDEAFRRGAIPYYGTSLSNIQSQRIALASGFVPAWVEAETRECGDCSFAK